MHVNFGFVFLQGAFPKRLLRKAFFREQHFDENFVFESRLVDRITGEVCS